MCSSSVLRSVMKRNSMKNTSKFSLLYYFSVGLISIGLILSILRGLQWPLSSEIITGAALFIHSIILARAGKDLFLAAQQKGLISNWFFEFQHGYGMSKSNSESDGWSQFTWNFLTTSNSSPSLLSNSLLDYCISSFLRWR